MPDTPQVIGFLSAPGGVGKTTIALCLSWFLKESGKRNLLIDLDPSLGLTLSLKDYEEYQGTQGEKRTSSYLLKAAKEGNFDRDVEALISRARFKKSLRFISSSMELADTIGEIWYGESLGRGKVLKRAIDYISPQLPYDYILIDVIPCYEVKYTLLTLLASDYCIIPLRPALADLGRTKNMFSKLKERVKTSLSPKEVENKLYFLFNRVRNADEDKIKTYGKKLKNTFPETTVFDNYIEKTVSFRRLNTNEEKSYDERKVRSAFDSFYKEFKEKIL